MKRNKKFWFKFALAFSLFTASIVFFTLNYNVELFTNIFDYSLKNPYRVIRDSKENLIIKDFFSDGTPKIIKASKDGIVSFVRKGKGRGTDEFYDTRLFECDSDGYLYVNNIILNIDDGLIEVDEIQRWYPDGRYDATIYRREYDAKTRKEISDQDKIGLIGLQVKGDSVYFYTHELNGELILRKVRKEGGKIEEILSLPFEGTFTDICGTEAGQIFFSLNDGIIKVIERDASIKELKPGRLAGNFLYPSSFKYVNDKYIFIDQFSHTIITTNNEIILNKLNVGNLKEFGFNKDSSLITMFSIGFDGKISAVEKKSGNIVVLDSNNHSIKYLEKLYKNSKMIVLEFAVIISAFIAFLSIIVIMNLIYIVFLNRKFPLILKSIIIYIPIIMTGLYVTQTIYFDSFNTIMDEEIKIRFSQLAQLGAKLIDARDVEALNTLRDSKSNSYERLKKQMNILINNNQDKWNSEIYIWIYKVRDDGNFYYIASYETDFFFPYAVQQEHKDVFNDGKIRTAHFIDETGEWMSGIAPIINSTGKIIGVCEVSKSMFVTAEREKQFRDGIIRSIMFIIIPFIAVFVLMSYFLLRNIRRLHKSIGEVAKKNFDVSVIIKSRDEIEDLGNGFNAMSAALKNYIAEINQLHSASMRFVPRQFLKYLNKRKLTDVNLGDQINLDMTILFSDIRNFTTLSENMTPEDTFNFINSYLKCMGPVISKYHGFIDKYIGDAIMALFPDFGDSAILSAIEMKKTLVEFNNKRHNDGLPDISIGIGLHSGCLMLGIIGEEERIDSTVLSDAVNLASRLESLTKHYHTSIIISEDVLNACIHAEKFNIRLIDRVIVKGKSDVINLYEVFDGDEEMQFVLKKETLPIFKEAYEYYKNADFAMAQSLLKNILLKNPDDAIAKIYTIRCDAMIGKEVPENWSGITVYSSK